MESSNQESGQGKDTADPTPNELNAMVQQRRAELGIKPSEPENKFAGYIERFKPQPATVLSHEQIAAREKREAEQEARQEYNRRSGIMISLMNSAGGERFRSCSFKMYEAKSPLQKRILAACQEFANGINERIANCENMLLYGPVGSGKDHLAFATCWIAVMDHGKTAAWINAQDWFGDIRDAMDGDATESSIISRLCNDDILVVSDPLPPFGSLTQYQSSMLYRLVNERYTRNKLTIFTVNVANDSEADERLGAAIWDRMNHGAWKMFCNWASHRKPVKEIK